MLVFNLGFQYLGLRESFATCVATNHTVHSLNRELGLKQTGIVSAGRIIGGKPVDMVQFVLHADDWFRCCERLVPLAEFAAVQIRQWEKRFLNTSCHCIPRDWFRRHPQ